MMMKTQSSTIKKELVSKYTTSNPKKINIDLSTNKDKIIVNTSNGFLNSSLKGGIQGHQSMLKKNPNIPFNSNNNNIGVSNVNRPLIIKENVNSMNKNNINSNNNNNNNYKNTVNNKQKSSLNYNNEQNTNTHSNNSNAFNNNSQNQNNITTYSLKSYSLTNNNNNIIKKPINTKTANTKSVSKLPTSNVRISIEQTRQGSVEVHKTDYNCNNKNSNLNSLRERTNTLENSYDGEELINIGHKAYRPFNSKEKFYNNSNSTRLVPSHIIPTQVTTYYNSNINSSRNSENESIFCNSNSFNNPNNNNKYVNGNNSNSVREVFNKNIYIQQYNNNFFPVNNTRIETDINNYNHNNNSNNSNSQFKYNPQIKNIMLTDNSVMSNHISNNNNKNNNGLYNKKKIYQCSYVNSNNTDLSNPISQISSNIPSKKESINKLINKHTKIQKSTINLEDYDNEEKERNSTAKLNNKDNDVRNFINNIPSNYNKGYNNTNNTVNTSNNNNTSKVSFKQSLIMDNDVDDFNNKNAMIVSSTRNSNNNYNKNSFSLFSPEKIIDNSKSNTINTNNKINTKSFNKSNTHSKLSSITNSILPNNNSNNNNNYKLNNTHQNFYNNPNHNTLTHISTTSPQRYNSVNQNHNRSYDPYHPFNSYNQFNHQNYNQYNHQLKPNSPYKATQNIRITNDDAGGKIDFDQIYKNLIIIDNDLSKNIEEENNYETHVPEEEVKEEDFEPMKISNNDNYNDYDIENKNNPEFNYKTKTNTNNTKDTKDEKSIDTISHFNNKALRSAKPRLLPKSIYKDNNNNDDNNDNNIKSNVFRITEKENPISFTIISNDCLSKAKTDLLNNLTNTKTNKDFIDITINQPIKSMNSITDTNAYTNNYILDTQTDNINSPEMSYKYMNTISNKLSNNKLVGESDFKLTLNNNSSNAYKELSISELINVSYLYNTIRPDISKKRKEFEEILLLESRTKDFTINNTNQRINRFKDDSLLIDNKSIYSNSNNSNNSYKSNKRNRYFSIPATLKTSFNNANYKLTTRNDSLFEIKSEFDYDIKKYTKNNNREKQEELTLKNSYNKNIFDSSKLQIDNNDNDDSKTRRSFFIKYSKNDVINSVNKKLSHINVNDFFYINSNSIKKNLVIDCNNSLNDNHKSFSIFNTNIKPELTICSGIKTTIETDHQDYLNIINNKNKIDRSSNSNSKDNFLITTNKTEIIRLLKHKANKLNIIDDDIDNNHSETHFSIISETGFNDDVEKQYNYYRNKLLHYNNRFISIDKDENKDDKNLSSAHFTIIPDIKEKSIKEQSTQMDLIEYDDKHIQTLEEMIKQENKEMNTSAIIIPQDNKETNTSKIEEEEVQQENKEMNTSAIITPQDNKETNTSIVYLESRDCNTSINLIPKDSKETNTSAIVIPQENKEMNTSIINIESRECNTSILELPKETKEYKEMNTSAIPYETKETNTSTFDNNNKNNDGHNLLDICTNIINFEILSPILPQANKLVYNRSQNNIHNLLDNSLIFEKSIVDTTPNKAAMSREDSVNMFFTTKNQIEKENKLDISIIEKNNNNNTINENNENNNEENMDIEKKTTSKFNTTGNLQANNKGNKKYLININNNGETKENNESNRDFNNSNNNNNDIFVKKITSNTDRIVKQKRKMSNDSINNINHINNKNTDNFDFTTSINKNKHPLTSNSNNKKHQSNSKDRYNNTNNNNYSNAGNINKFKSPFKQTPTKSRTNNNNINTNAQAPKFSINKNLSIINNYQTINYVNNKKSLSENNQKLLFDISKLNKDIAIKTLFANLIIKSEYFEFSYLSYFFNFWRNKQILDKKPLLKKVLSQYKEKERLQKSYYSHIPYQNELNNDNENENNNYSFSKEDKNHNISYFSYINNNNNNNNIGNNIDNYNSNNYFNTSNIQINENKYKKTYHHNTNNNSNNLNNLHNLINKSPISSFNYRKNTDSMYDPDIFYNNSSNKLFIIDDLYNNDSNFKDLLENKNKTSNIGNNNETKRKMEQKIRKLSKKSINYDYLHHNDNYEDNKTEIIVLNNKNTDINNTNNNLIVNKEIKKAHTNNLTSSRKTSKLDSFKYLIEDNNKSNNVNTNDSHENSYTDLKNNDIKKNNEITSIIKKTHKAHAKSRNYNKDQYKKLVDSIENSTSNDINDFNTDRINVNLFSVDNIVKNGNKKHGNNDKNEFNKNDLSILRQSNSYHCETTHHVRFKNLINSNHSSHVTNPLDKYKGRINNNVNILISNEEENNNNNNDNNNSNDFHDASTNNNENNFSRLSKQRVFNYNKNINKINSTRNVSNHYLYKHKPINYNNKSSKSNTILPHLNNSINNAKRHINSTNSINHIANNTYSNLSSQTKEFFTSSSLKQLFLSAETKQLSKTMKLIFLINTLKKTITSMTFATEESRNINNINSINNLNNSNEISDNINNDTHISLHKSYSQFSIFIEDDDNVDDLYLSYVLLIQQFFRNYQAKKYIYAYSIKLKSLSRVAKKLDMIKRNLVLKNFIYWRKVFFLQKLKNRVFIIERFYINKRNERKRRNKEDACIQFRNLFFDAFIYLNLKPVFKEFNNIYLSK